VVEAVVFDIGGVLAHDVWEHLLLDKEKGIASICQLNVNQVRKVGKELWEEFVYRPAVEKDEWKELEKEYWNRFIEILHLSRSADDFIQLTDQFIRPVEGMTQLLEDIQSQGIDLAICSNNNEFWFKRQMDKLGLCRFFSPDRVILSSRVGVSKSSPHFEMFKAVGVALGIHKKHCMLVDDRAKNIEQALRYGMPGIIFPSHSKYGAQYLKALLERMRPL
jgi:HAD superfamily hydrolase (TIGR01509 family)